MHLQSGIRGSWRQALSSLLFLFAQSSGTSAPGVVPSTFRVGLPTSLNLGLPHRNAQRPVSLFLDHVKLTNNINPYRYTQSWEHVGAHAAG